MGDFSSNQTTKITEVNLVSISAIRVLVRDRQSMRLDESCASQRIAFTALSLLPPNEAAQKGAQG